MSRRALAVTSIVTGSWLTLVESAAAQSATASDDQRISDEIKALEDPTILKNRIWLDTEWSKFKHNGDDLQETLGATWAWRVSSEQDWAIRIKVPASAHFAGDDPDKDLNGLGDVKLAAGTAFRLSNTWRTGGGVEIRMPTGTDHDLSDNSWRLQEFGAVAWDVTSWLTISPSFEHNHSIAEEPNVAPNHYLELYLPATLRLPGHWSIHAKYEAKLDFEDGNAWSHFAKLGVSKRLDDLPVALSLSIKKPLEESEKDFQINLVGTYYLQSR